MLVLASASPRRRELLAQAGFTFTVEPASIPEDVRPGESPEAYVTRLAREKAECVYTRLAAGGNDDLTVLGADTTVVAPLGEILAKPESEADAARMLRMLAGATHQVMTGLAIVTPLGMETAAEVTHVSMVTLSDEEIAAYVATGEPMDKAGAYGIQGYAGRWIPRIQGCYFNVMGLPLALVSAMLEGTGRRSELAARSSTGSSLLAD
ncbi:MAG TPA: Maf family protein [Acidobacteriaceae bacterium]|nr:Maf family protein [Acidobacteriaceae bacterium]